MSESFPESVNEELLSAYLDNELNSAERASVEKHLAEHPESRRFLNELAEVRAAIQSLPSQTLADGFSESVMSKLPSQTVNVANKNDSKPSEANSRRGWIYGLASIAALLLMGLFFADLLQPVATQWTAWSRLTDRKQPMDERLDDRLIEQPPQELSSASDDAIPQRTGKAMRQVNRAEPMNHVRNLPPTVIPRPTASQNLASDSIGEREGLQRKQPMRILDQPKFEPQPARAPRGRSSAPMPAQAPRFQRSHERKLESYPQVIVLEVDQEEFDKLAIKLDSWKLPTEKLPTEKLPNPKETTESESDQAKRELTFSIVETHEKLEQLLNSITATKFQLGENRKPHSTTTRLKTASSASTFSGRAAFPADHLNPVDDVASRAISEDAPRPELTDQVEPRDPPTVTTVSPTAEDTDESRPSAKVRVLIRLRRK